MKNSLMNSSPPYQEASMTLVRKRGELVRDFLDSLKLKKNTMEERGDPDGQDKGGFLQVYTQILDDYFREAFEKSRIGPTMGMAKNPYAIIALGGYGREEQCIHSDVDILFLFKDKIPQETESLIREMIYPLWDIGLDIGHATRSLKDCTTLAASDFEVLTSLLDARFICGISPLYSEMTDQLRQKVIYKKAGKIISWLVESNQERHRCFGDSTYLLEPNLKEGQGGLRDYHTMLWLCNIRYNLMRPKEMETHGMLTHKEYGEMQDALSFIWDVRCCLHYLRERKYDQLHFAHQVPLSRVMGFQQEEGLLGVERFLGELHGKMENIKQNHLMLLYELGEAKRWFQIRRRFPRKTQVAGLEVKKDTLFFSTPANLLKNPHLLIRVFEESLRLKIPLATETKRLVREFTHIVDDAFRRDKEILKAFEKILTVPAPQFNVLKEMMASRFLVAYIPEFKGIVNRTEYDSYHVYPVDMHSIKTVQTLKSMGSPEDPTQDPLCGELIREMPRKKIMYWAGLLHDIGKGIPDTDHTQSGAKMADIILTRAGMKEEDRETVCFLILEHLLLLATATRRDIHDDETIWTCAARIKSPVRLKMLYLLTMADLIATGPKAINDWVSSLLRELFFRLLHTLEQTSGKSGENIGDIQKTKEDILSRAALPENQVNEILSELPPRYLIQVPADTVVRHLELFQSVSGTHAFAMDFEKHPLANLRIITLMIHDHPGCISLAAGVMTLNKINILEMQAYTWNNGYRVSIFTVTPPQDPLFEEDKWRRIRKDFDAALSSVLDVEKELECTCFQDPAQSAFGTHKSQIRLDNETSSFYTIIEVHTEDHPGLLFHLTNAFFHLGLIIHNAQIATKVHHAVDVFYLKDGEGKKIESREKLEEIQQRIREVLVISCSMEK